MMVLVDTPVWSLALRRRSEDLSPQEQQLTQALAELIREGRVQMLRPIRQELLSGLREEAHFRKLRDYLRAFPETPLEAADYEEGRSNEQSLPRPQHRRIGGGFSNLCRRPRPRLGHSYHGSGFP